MTFWGRHGQGTYVLGAEGSIEYKCPYCHHGTLQKITRNEFGNRPSSPTTCCNTCSQIWVGKGDLKAISEQKPTKGEIAQWKTRILKNADLARRFPWVK